MKKAIAFFLLLSWTTPLLAQPQRVIGYVNGVFNTEEDAQITLNVLYGLYRIDFQGEMSREEFEIQYRKELFYNETACPDDPDAGIFTKVTCLGDLFEAGVQNGSIQTAREFWELEDVLVRADPATELAEEVAQAALDVVIDLSEQIIVEDTEVIRNQIQELTDAGHEVVMVMHSQGNFFGNDAWDELNGYGQLLTTPVSIATPDSRVANSGEYTTVHCDPIDSVPFALPSNLSSIDCPWFPGTGVAGCKLMCHAVMTYLSGGVSDSLSRSLIFGYIHQGFEGAIPSESLIENGSFTFGTDGWTLAGDFWAGTTLSNYLSPYGYSAGGVDSNGFHKNNASGTMEQTVFIPANQGDVATLRFHLNITTDEPTSEVFDQFGVLLFNGDTGEYISTPIFGHNGNASSSPTDYDLFVIDMSGFLGRSIKIQFKATSDNSYPTVFRIDDVSLIVR